MVEHKIGKHKVKLYTSISELPVERFFTYNRMLIIDSGLGSDMEAIDQHIGNAIRYVGIDNKKLAIQELENMRASFYLITENMSPKHLSYAALVYSVDGKIMDDFSDENLKALVTQFSSWGATQGFISRALDAVKKKSIQIWKLISLKCSRAPRERKYTER